MIKSYSYEKREAENVLIYTYTNHKNVTVEKRIPIRDEKGKFTEEFLREVKTKKAQKYLKELGTAAVVEETKEAEIAFEETKVAEAVETVEAVEEVVEPAAISTVNSDDEIIATETKEVEETEETEVVIDSEEETEKVESNELVEQIEVLEGEVIDTEETGISVMETAEVMVPETALAVVNYEEAPVELKKKKCATWKKVVAGILLVGAGIFALSKIESCTNKEQPTITVTTPIPTPEQETTPTPVVKPTETPTTTPTPVVKPTETPTTTPEVVIPSVEEQIEDTRYTTVTNELFEETVFNLKKELADHGIELNGEDVVKFVTLANFTHIQETNPELLQTILGEATDGQQFITKAAQIIGQVVYLEITDKNETVDWTVGLIDAKDKEIADNYMKNVIGEAKAYAEGDPVIPGGTYATRDEKTEYIQKLVLTGFVSRDFDKTLDVQEPGADFVTDAIVTGILLGDTEIKQFISDKELIDSIKSISKNKDVTPTLVNLIENYGTGEKAKVKSLTNEQ